MSESETGRLRVRCESVRGAGKSELENGSSTVVDGRWT